ncbi:MAG: DUF6249 domain-containing protein [Sodaliphilus sp.]
MKKVLFTAMVMLITLFSTPSEAKVGRSGDTTIIINNGDTAIVTDSAVKSVVVKAINDTIWSSNLDEDGDFVGVDDDVKNRKTAAEISTQWANVAETATYTIFAGIVVVVFLCLLFYFLNRRSKYKAIEKAIENNYPLPPSLGGSGQPKPSQPNAWRNYTPNTPPAPPAGATPSGAAPQQQAPQQPTPPPMYYRSNYHAYNGSIKLIAVGLALMIFFLFTGAEPMVGLTSMLVLLGLGKAFITYKEQQQDREYWQWQAMQPQQQPQPQQPAPEAQPQPQQEENAEPQPPVFTNPDSQQ